MILWYKSGCKSCSRRTCTMSNDRKVESYAAELGQFGDISSGGGGCTEKKLAHHYLNVHLPLIMEIITPQRRSSLFAYIF